MSRLFDPIGDSITSARAENGGFRHAIAAEAIGPMHTTRIFSGGK